MATREETFRKGPRKPRSVSDMERAVEIACKRLSQKALMVLEKALDEECTPGLEMRWRLAAAKEVLDRGYGRPKQTIDASVRMETAESLVDAIKSSRMAAASTVLQAAQESVH